MAVVKTASPTARAGRADARRPARPCRPRGSSADRRSCRHPRRRRWATVPAGEREQAAALHLAAEEGAVAAARAEVGLARRRSARADPRARGRPRLADRDARHAAARRRAPGPRSCARRSVSSVEHARARRGRGTSAGKAVSSPITPFGAASNGTSFSPGACGAWSVAMQSIVPSRSAVDQRLAVRLGGQRRAHLEACGVERAAPPRRSAAGGAARPRRRRRRPSARARRTSSTDSRDVQVAEVERPALVAGDAQVAGDHRRLGDRRVAAEAEPARDGALVHVGARARATGPRSAARARGPSIAAYCSARRSSAGREHRAAVVGEAARRRGRRARRAARAARRAGRPRSRPGSRRATRASSRGALVQRVAAPRRVDHRVGVGHREDACSSRRRRPRPCRSRGPPCAPGRACAGARAGR